MRVFIILTPLSITVTGTCQVDLKNGLKLYYPFSGNITDSSGNKNNPNKSKTEFTEDRFGNANSACHFNGKNSFISVPDAASLRMNDEISLCVWIRPTGFYKGSCDVNCILMKGRQGNESGYFLRFDDNLYKHDGNCYSKRDEEHENFSGNSTNYPSYEPYVQLMKWQNVIYTYDGKSARIYIDGKLVKTEESVLALYFRNRSPLFIGKEESPQFPYWLNADLDDLRIYDRAINMDEITAISSNNIETKN